MSDFACDFRIVGKERPRVVKGRTFTPIRTADCEAAIARNARLFGLEKVTGRVAVDIVMTYAGEKKPDTDNALKTILDALNGIGYDDDSQVDDIRIRRVGKTGVDCAYVHVSLVPRSWLLDTARRLRLVSKACQGIISRAADAVMAKHFKQEEAVGADGNCFPASSSRASL